MAQDINVSIDYFEHPKTRRLVGLLKKGSEVLPVRLWCYCGKYHAETGRLTDHCEQEIESAMGWWGAPGAAVAAMVKVGFLDRHGDTYAVHDWAEHNGQLHAFHVRAKKGANARWARLRGEQATGPPAGDGATGNAQASVKQCANGTNETNSPPNPPHGGGGGGGRGGRSKTKWPRSCEGGYDRETR